MYSCLFNSNNTSLQPGLFFSCYNNYMADNVAFFNTAGPIPTSKTVSGQSIYGATSIISNLNDGTNGCISITSTPQNFSIQWVGYFKPETTSSNWRFRTTSDDCSFLWIGTNALTGFSTVNADVNNGGLHADRTIISNAITLTAGLYYPLRIQFGESTGGNVMQVEFSPDSINWFSDGTDKYFHT